MPKKKQQPTSELAGRPRPLPVRPSDVFASMSFGLADRWSTHPGQGLTPRRIVSIFREAEAGYPLRQCDLFEDVIESDAHLRSLVDGRIDDVAGKEWVVLPGGDSSADVDAAAALEAALRAVPSTTEMLEHQLTANAFGWAASEIVWERVDGLIVPVWFENVPHRRFRFDIESDSPLLVTQKKAEGEPLEPGKWIFGRRRGRLAVTAGFMRTAAWWSLFKRTSVRDWVVWVERFGLPYVVGRYEANASDEDKKVLEEAVQQLGKDGSAVFSQACEITMTEAAKGGTSDGAHAALVGLCDAQNSKLIAGATLTSETAGPGSYALGKVHENKAFALVLGDEQRLGQRIALDLGAAFVKFNGLDARPPRLKVHVVREVDPMTRASVMAVLLNDLGVPLDEEQVRQEFQVRRPPPGRELKPVKPAGVDVPGVSGQ